MYVDGAMMGVTPTTIPMLTEGPHSITLVMDGYQDLKTTITINAGTTSEYITGLPKTTKTPGFAAGIAAISTRDTVPVPENEKIIFYGPNLFRAYQSLYPLLYPNLLSRVVRHLHSFGAFNSLWLLPVDNPHDSPAQE